MCLEAERAEFTALLEAAEKERQELEHDARELDMKSSSLQVRKSDIFPYGRLDGSKDLIFTKRLYLLLSTRYYLLVYHLLNIMVS